MKCRRIGAAFFGISALIIAPAISWAAGPTYGYLSAQNSLSELVGNAATARTNLGLGTAATQASTAFDAAGAAAAATASALQKTNNFSDIGNAATARTNLGLGTAATQASTAFDAAGAAAAATASALQKANNFSDIGNATTARTNLGLGTAATQASTAFDAAGAAAAATASALQKANNFSDIASAATARTNLGLGTAATQASTAFDPAGAAAAATATALQKSGGTLTGPVRPLISDGLSGAGTTQATAALLTASVDISTSSAAPYRLPGAGDSTTIGTIEFRNEDPANAATIYPPTGGQIDTVGTNGPVSVPPGATIIFQPGTTAGQWWV